MKKIVDFSKIRGFNYTQSNAWDDTDFWDHYDHDIVERDMGYAQRLHLNSARIFLTYSTYMKEPEKFLADVKDFVKTAWKHGVSTNPIIYHGFRFIPEDFQKRPQTNERLHPLAKTITDPSLWVLGEKYFDDLLKTIGEEPGLLFWDISNEPGYTDNFVTWYDEEPEFIQEFRDKPDMAVLRERQEAVWKIVRHFCKYVKQKDPNHDLGVGNIFIFETEASGTADLVDVIIFHDYSSTKNQMRAIYEMAISLGEKYNKPVLNNETACLCRANPYDRSIEMAEEYGVGWYIFELMIGEDGWNRVHGVVYPDGSIRDPSVVAALFGFYRNRGEMILRADINQENAVAKLTARANRLLEATRRPNRRDHSNDAGEILELCDCAANLLEAGELTAMNYPPSAIVETYRRRNDCNVDEMKDRLFEWISILKKASRII
jgi:hypothetical protein